MDFNKETYLSHSNKILEKIQDSGVEFVRFVFSDFHGIAKGKVLPASGVAVALDNGVGIYLSTIIYGPAGSLEYVPKIIQDNGFPDAVLFPDPNSFRVLPWASDKGMNTGQVICEHHWATSLSYAYTPRTIARNQLEELKKMGFTLFSGIEHEFTVLDKSNLEPICPGYQSKSMLDLCEQQELLYDMVRQIRDAGVKILSFHREINPGQFEMAQAPVFGIEGVDAAFLIKDAVKSICAKKGLIGTFMTMPFFYKSCNTSHFSHSVWKQGEGLPTRVMDDSEDELGMSDFMQWWIAGLLKHARAMTALCWPTVNCYRAASVPLNPVKANWGIDNRATLLRIRSSPKGMFVENRLPSGLANPYLVMAVTIAAGIDGIRKQLPLPKQADFEEGAPIPKSLGEALQALEEDTIICESLGEEFVRWFCATKRENEIKLGTDRSHDKYDGISAERTLYLKYCG